MRVTTLCLIGVLGIAEPAFADPAGSVWLPTLGISMPSPAAVPAGPVATPAIRPMPSTPVLAPPPAFVPPVPQPGSYSAVPGANDPVDQQKQALYRTQLQSYQRELASRPGGSPGTAFNALQANQALNQLRLQAPN
jgi:hypothetical protein